MDGEELQRAAAGFVGLTADEARARAGELGITLRVIEPGGVYTMDIRTDRITAETQDGRVVTARVQ